MDFVVHCVTFFKFIIEECSRFSSSACLEVVKTVGKDSIYRQLASKHSNFIRSDQSILEQVVEMIAAFCNVAKQRPEIISKTYNFNENSDSWIEDIASSVSEIIVCLSKVFEAYRTSLKDEEKERCDQEYEVSSDLI